MPEGEGFSLVLINPEHYKAVRGKKTDMKDGKRIAELLQDARLKGSYAALARGTAHEQYNLNRFQPEQGHSR